MTPTDKALKARGLSKASLSFALQKASYTLSSQHWAHLDRLLKTGRGWILPEAVVEAARGWGWTSAQLTALRRALK